uniref:Mitochondrial inner membrane protein COX18 n=1 Tax=Rhabditophanes sp. KR3021 TaxID=114890 RepID=A0AC35UC13_9BILA
MFLNKLTGRSPHTCRHAVNTFGSRRNASNLPSMIAPIFEYAANANVTQVLQAAMEGVHATTGLGWGTTFIVSGFLLRAATSPAHIYAEKLFADRIHISNHVHKTVIEKIGKECNIKVRPNETNTQLQLMTNNTEIVKKAVDTINDNLQTIVADRKLFASRIQNLKICTVPVWIFSSFAVRNVVSGDFNPAMPGALWINDLLLPDPYFILPLAVGILGFANMYSQKLIYPSQTTFQARTYDFLLAFMTIVAVRIMMDLPACVSMYWMSVSVSGMVLNGLVRHPKIKGIFGIKRLPTDSKYPLLNLFQKRGKN